MRVVPEEADARPRERKAIDRLFASPSQIKELQVGTRVHASHDIGEEREGDERDRSESRRQTIQPIGEINRIAGAREDERGKGYIEPRQTSGCRYDEHVLQKRHGGGRAGQSRDRKLPQNNAEDDTDRDLAGKLVAFNQSLVLPSLALLPEFEVVVESPKEPVNLGDKFVTEVKAGAFPAKEHHF